MYISLLLRFIVSVVQRYLYDQLGWQRFIRNALLCYALWGK